MNKVTIDNIAPTKELLRITERELPDLGGGRRVKLVAYYGGKEFHRYWFEGGSTRDLAYKKKELLRDIEQYMRTGKLPTNQTDDNYRETNTELRSKTDLA